MKNAPFEDAFPIEHGDNPIAMLVYQRVTTGCFGGEIRVEMVVVVFMGFLLAPFWGVKIFFKFKMA